MRNAENEFPGISENLAQADLTKLTSPEEIDLIKILASWPHVIERAALSYEPHRIVFFLHELASTFHSLWNVGNNKHELRFLVANNRELTMARLCLVRATAVVIASGLQLCAIIPQEHMG